MAGELMSCYERVIVYDNAATPHGETENSALRKYISEIRRHAQRSH